MRNNRRNIFLDQWSKHLAEKILVEISNGFNLALDYLEWDSNFFGLPCYVLKWEQSCWSQESFEEDHSREIAAGLPEVAIWAKLPVTVPQGFISAFQILGAKFIETEITLRYDGKSKPIKPLTGIQVFKAESTDLPGFIELGNTFSLTRFHIDQRITLQKAKELWISYLRNYSLSDFKHAFLAQKDNSVAGAILISNIQRNGEDLNCIDITAVHPNMGLKGVGSVLMQYVLNWCGASGRATTVSTQHRNVAAINYYLKNGFTIFDTPRSVFHLWS